MGRRVLRCHIWGYSVCLCRIKRTSGLHPVMRNRKIVKLICYLNRRLRIKPFCRRDERSKTTVINAPCREKTSLRCFIPGPTQTGLYSDRRLIEASNFGFRKYLDCAIYKAKTKALISCAVTAQLILHMLKAGFLMTRLKLY